MNMRPYVGESMDKDVVDMDDWTVDMEEHGDMVYVDPSQIHVVADQHSQLCKCHPQAKREVSW